MPVTRTFVDADALINAFRGTGAVAAAAQAIIDDPDREFVTSDILRLELLPKPHYFSRTAEEQFYDAYFQAAVTYVETTPQLVADAEAEARNSGLAAADALHIVAARTAGAQEFVTAEKSTSPLFRVTTPTVTTVRP